MLEKVEKSLKSNGLPPLDWYDVLLELHREGSLGLRQYEIGERVLLNKHNLSRLIDRLEKDQLVRRHARVEDRRGNRIKITDDGERMLKQVWPVYSESIQENFGDKVNSDELVDLLKILGRVLGQDHA